MKKPAPIIPYAISKNKLRLKLLKLKKDFNFNFTWLRFFIFLAEILIVNYIMI